MKNSMLILCICGLLNGCDHNIPIANLQFKKFEKGEDYDYLYFSSDVELIENLHKHHVGARFRCLFTEKKTILFKDTRERNEEIYYSNGRLNLDTTTIYSDNNYHYIAKLFYVKNINFGSNSEIIEGEEVKKLLKDLECLPCVVEAVAYMHLTKPYISNTMCIPTFQILKKL